MKFTDRIINFYRGIENNVKEGKGCIYKLDLLVDWEKLKSKLLAIDHFLNQINTENEAYAALLRLAKRIKPYHKSREAINSFLNELYLSEKRPLPLLFIDQDKNLLFYDVAKTKNEKWEIPSIFMSLTNLIKPLIDCEWQISSYDSLLFCSIIKKRLSYIENFFLIENGDFIRNLIKNFPDEISKKSFQAYLEQRYKGVLHGDWKTVYPVIPPKITQKWRNERLSMSYALPSIKGASESSKQWFYYSTFKLEQYAVRPGFGICEVEEGDTVIDGGAFVGDTAMYFAQKTGSGGKVYAFEPVKSIIDFTKLNLKENDLDSIVEVIPYALSDTSKVLYFTDDASDSTSVDFENPENNLDVELAESVKKSDLMEIKAVSLDNFVEERGIRKVDFLKADLQGADVDFVKGALKTIARDAPKCGLTVYHKEEDFIAIPKLLMSARDDYVFYFRCETEPVLFAKKKK